MNIGQDFYSPFGNQFRIYPKTEPNEYGLEGNYIGESYRDKEVARKRVYKLNGWKYNAKD